MLHQVGVSFDLYYDARKHKIKMSVSCNGHFHPGERHPVTGEQGAWWTPGSIWSLDGKKVCWPFGESKCDLRYMNLLFSHCIDCTMAAGWLAVMAV